MLVQVYSQVVLAAEKKVAMIKLLLKANDQSKEEASMLIQPDLARQARF